MSNTTGWAISYETAIIGRYATEREMETAYAGFIARGLNEDKLAWHAPKCSSRATADITRP